MQNLLSIEN